MQEFVQCQQEKAQTVVGFNSDKGRGLSVHIMSKLVMMMIIISSCGGNNDDDNDDNNNNNKLWWWWWCCSRKKFALEQAMKARRG